MASESPCISVCVIAPATNLCVGCGRTLEEISVWAAMTPNERRNIMAGLISRLSAVGMEVRPALRERLTGLEG
jgi:predicted Fe-S protein YdhL (DUF1289 family)